MLYEPIDVTIGLKRLKFVRISDRYYGDVEPYIIPIFFKIDGERYKATLNIDGFTLLSGLDEILDTINVEFGINTTPTEDNPLIYVPNGNLLGRGDFDEGETADVSDISYRTVLEPIPFEINVDGIGNHSEILSFLADLIVESDGFEALNTTIININEALAELLGIDTEFDSCPPIEDEIDEIVNYIDAQFNCLIPGTIGAVYAVMENDNFSESEAKDVQDAIKNEVHDVINKTMNSIAVTSPVPQDPESYVSQGDIILDAISSIGPSIGIKAGINLAAIIILVIVNIWAAIAAAIISVAYWAGGLDDFINVHVVAYDHTNIEEAKSNDDELLKNEIDGNDNHWRLYFFKTIN